MDRGIPFAVVLPVVAAALAPLVAAAWHAHRESRRAATTADLLYGALQDLLGATLDRIGVIVSRCAASLFDADSSEFMLVDANRGDAAVLWTWRDGAARIDAVGPADSVGAPYWGLARTAVDPFVVDVGEHGVGTVIIVPLTVHGACVGMLRLGFARPVRPGDRQVHLLRTFASHVAAAVRAATLLEETAEERETLRRVVEHSSDGIFSVDDQGRIISWNPAMERVTGMSADDVVGLPIAIAMDGVTDGGEFVSTAWLARRLATTDQFEELVHVHDGVTGKRLLAMSVSTVRSSDAEVAFAVGVARDVTAAREVDLVKQDFVATVSHELRTPLTPIKGFLLTLLRNDIQLDGSEVRFIHSRMLDQALRLERLIEDLLTISQLDRATFSIERREVALGEIVERLCADMPRSVEVGVPPGVSVVADAGRVEQVLSNLLGNAHKYTPLEGRVSVDVERRRNEVVVSVRDEGPGIPVHEQETIFERFRRLGDHMTRSSGGTGLGLYIAQCLVDAMGGRIWVESAPGAGSCFRFTLPAVPGAGRAEVARERRLTVVS